MWKKFKTQIISIILIWLIFGIYEDLIRIFEVKEISTLLYILFAKWVIIGFIVLYNILLIKSIKKSDNNEVFRNEENILPKKSQEILDKKEILTRTDLILKKYSKDK